MVINYGVEESEDRLNEMYIEVMLVFGEWIWGLYLQEIYYDNMLSIFFRLMGVVNLVFLDVRDVIF